MVKNVEPNNRLAQQQGLKLHQSVYLKDIDRIHKLIANGVQDLVNIREPTEGLTAIHVAVGLNDIKIIDILFDYGANCNIIDNNGRTVYMKAAALGHFEILNLLITLCENPELDSVDNEGRNLLYYCLHNTQRHQLCFNLGIECGGDVNVIPKDGRPLLFQACALGLMDVVELLLGTGVDVNQKNVETGETTLHIPCRTGNSKIALLLLRCNANPDICDNKSKHCAHKATKNDHLQVLHLLSGYGANLGAYDENQDTPMHIAAQKGLTNICKFLGQRGCWATLKNKKGYTPRILAKNAGHKLAVKACKKAEKNKGEKPGTEFDAVRFYDFLQAKKEIILQEVGKCTCDEVGKVKVSDMTSILKKLRTPLNHEGLEEIIHIHDPIYEGVIEYEVFLSGKRFIHKSILVKLSKEKDKRSGKKGGGGGGRKNVKTKVEFPICTNKKDTLIRPDHGGPLINFIQRQEELVTDRTRFDRDHRPSNHIHDDSYWYQQIRNPEYIHVNEAVKSDDQDTLKMALRNGYEVDRKDKYHKTPLMQACLSGNYKLARFLLNHGADINAVDNFRWSAIHFACLSGQRDLVELLLNKGADIDCPALNGGVPLMRAIESASVDVVQLLIDRDAKVHIQTKKGLTPLQIAKSYSDPRIVSIMEKRVSEVPAPVVERKRNFSPIKGNPNNKIGSSTPVLPAIHPQPEVILPTRSSENSLMAAFNVAEKQDSDTQVSFQANKSWLPQLTTDQLLSKKENKRNRYGVEVDFENYKPPFKNQIDDIVSSLEVGTR